VVRLVPASGRRPSVPTDDAGTGERPTSGEARAIAEKPEVDGRGQVDGRLMSPAPAIASSPPSIEAPRAAAEVAGSRAVAEPPLVDQVVQTARLVVTDGLTHMEVQLDPPTLGTVRVTAAASGDGIQLTIAAEQADTRALLLQAIPEIQSALSARGVAAAAVAVSHTFDQPEGRRAPARREAERESRSAHTPGERRRERSAPSRPVATVDFTV
jgi:flagellar hook-length control protein FliK